MQSLPGSASTISGQTDTIFAVLIGLSAFFALAVFIAITYFIIKYRRGAKVDRSNPPTHNLMLEVGWIGIPLVLALGMFTWAASSYFNIVNPPANSLEIFVVGKQWMWKFQHPTGQSEISDLHVPMGRPVKLTMISEDVIHSFFVPAFRVKQDVLPGRYTSLWFQATQPGIYYLFCTQYCGADHSEMGGRIIVMEPEAYQQWLTSGTTVVQAEGTPQAIGLSLAAEGEQLFQASGCSACHVDQGKGVGPSLVGLYGSQVAFDDGTSALADDTYLHQSILDPNRQIVAGYHGIMPTYRGQLTEDQVVQLIAY